MKKSVIVRNNTLSQTRKDGDVLSPVTPPSASLEIPKIREARSSSNTSFSDTLGTGHILPLPFGNNMQSLETVSTHEFLSRSSSVTNIRDDLISEELHSESCYEASERVSINYEFDTGTMVTSYHKPEDTSGLNDLSTSIDSPEVYKDGKHFKPRSYSLEAPCSNNNGFYNKRCKRKQEANGVVIYENIPVPSTADYSATTKVAETTSKPSLVNDTISTEDTNTKKWGSNSEEALEPKSRAGVQTELESAFSTGESYTSEQEILADSLRKSGQTTESVIRHSYQMETDRNSEQLAPVLIAPPVGARIHTYTSPKIPSGVRLTEREIPSDFRPPAPFFRHPYDYARLVNLLPIPPIKSHEELAYSEPHRIPNSRNDSYIQATSFPHIHCDRNFYRLPHITRGLPTNQPHTGFPENGMLRRMNSYAPQSSVEMKYQQWPGIIRQLNTQSHDHQVHCCHQGDRHAAPPLKAFFRMTNSYNFPNRTQLSRQRPDTIHYLSLQPQYHLCLYRQQVPVRSGNTFLFDMKLQEPLMDARMPALSKKISGLCCNVVSDV